MMKNEAMRDVSVAPFALLRYNNNKLSTHRKR